MKIFIGLEDIASQVSDLKQGFSKLGVETYTAVINTQAVQAGKIDEVIAKDNFLTALPLRPYRLRPYLQYGYRSRRLLKKLAKTHDVFIFVWRTFRNDISDLQYLKSLNKKIVVFFMGSDQRWRHSYEQEVALYGVPSYFSRYPQHVQEHFSSLNYLEGKLRYLRNVEKYADVIYSLPNQSQLALRPYSHFYIPINTEIIEEKPVQRKIPVIAHAPTSREIKGTDILLKTLDKLKDEGVKFELLLIENKPYFEALQLYASADIVVGEMFIPSGGKLDRECLAAGKVVLSSIRRDYIDNVPEECPIIDINPENIYTQLKTIIEDFPRRTELAKRGRAFVEKYHDITTVCRDVLDKLESYSIQKSDSDFYPDFFRQKFVPEEDCAYCEVYNNWTQYVSQCDWYKRLVPSGMRVGLRF